MVIFYHFHVSHVLLVFESLFFCIGLLSALNMVKKLSTSNHKFIKPRLSYRKRLFYFGQYLALEDLETGLNANYIYNKNHMA